MSVRMQAPGPAFTRWGATSAVLAAVWASWVLLEGSTAGGALRPLALGGGLALQALCPGLWPAANGADPGSRRRTWLATALRLGYVLAAAALLPVGSRPAPEGRPFEALAPINPLSLLLSSEVRRGTRRQSSAAICHGCIAGVSSASGVHGAYPCMLR